MRIAALAVTAIWVVMIGMSTGAVAALFPDSITIDSGHFYIWASRLSDTFASLTLIFIVFIAYLNVQHRSKLEITLSENDDVATEVGSTNLAPTSTVLDVEPETNSDNRIFVHVATRRQISVIAMFVGIVLLASVSEQVLGGNHFNTSIEGSAVSLSENNLILPALEATLRELPRNFSPSAYEQYFLASEWASNVGATGTAANLYELLVQASINIESPIGLVEGLNQYFVEESHAISKSVREHMLTTNESSSWRMTVQAAFQWQKSGNGSAIIRDFKASIRDASPSLRQEFRAAIGLVESYDSAA